MEAASSIRAAHHVVRPPGSALHNLEEVYHAGTCAKRRAKRRAAAGCRPLSPIAVVSSPGSGARAAIATVSRLHHLRREDCVAPDPPFVGLPRNLGPALEQRGERLCVCHGLRLCGRCAIGSSAAQVRRTWPAGRGAAGAATVVTRCTWRAAAPDAGLVLAARDTQLGLRERRRHRENTVPFCCSQLGTRSQLCSSRSQLWVCERGAVTGRMPCVLKSLLEAGR